jgi:dephospho-CoA kinase
VGAAAIIVLIVRSEKNLYIIGLTGGIASGKTTAANVLKKLGAVVLDADKVSRELVKKDEPAYEEIIDVFGKDILDKDGNIKRDELAEIVFNNNKLLTDLENIIHPRVIKAFHNKINEIKKKYPHKVIVMDVPLLIESNMHKMADEIWIVAVNKEEQIKRLINRDNISYEEALRKIENQMSLEDKLKYADKVINTEKSIKETEKEIVNLWHNIKE